jgi:hypothetical protein
MKKILTKSVVLLIIIFSFCGCKKYPDDDHFLHLQTVKNRLCKKWSYKSNDLFDIVFKEDGYFWSDGLPPFGIFPLYLAVSESTARWDLIDHKKKIRITNTYDNKTYDFTIDRLDKDNDGIMTLYLKNDSTTIHFQEVHDN